MHRVHAEGRGVCRVARWGGVSWETLKRENPSEKLSLAVVVYLPPQGTSTPPMVMPSAGPCKMVATD
eukprot:8325236-Pyramimonas_sp.AAC.1